MYKIITCYITVIVLAASLTGCTTQLINTEADDSKVNIVTTIFPIYDFTRAIVKDNANIEMMVSPGASIHSFDPSPADISTIVGADVFIYIGGESDIWVDKILDSLDTSNMIIVRLIEHVNLVEEELIEGMEADEHEHDDEHDNEHDKDSDAASYDEHIWTSPQNSINLINAIENAIALADTANSNEYRKNANNYISQIKELDTEIREIINSAAQNKIVVADRFPFRYLVDDYGIEYSAAFAGCSDQSEASVATIAHLIKTVQNENIPYVYYAELSTQNVARSVSEQTGAELLLLHSCQNVTKTEFDDGETYLSLMRQNAENLKKGLN